MGKKDLFIKYFFVSSSLVFLIVCLYPFYFSKLTLEIYLKDYSSLILIYLTYVYVLLTYFILNSSNKLAKEQLRPYVIANFVEENNYIYFSIKNYGRRPAFNIIVNISDGFDNLQIASIRGNYKHLLKQTFIAPSQEIRNLVADPGSVLRSNKNSLIKCFDLEVSFYDSDSKKYELRYQIDFSNLYDEKSIRSESILDGLKAISIEIKKIKEFISKLH